MSHTGSEKLIGLKNGYFFWRGEGGGPNMSWASQVAQK